MSSGIPFPPGWALVSASKGNASAVLLWCRGRSNQPVSTCGKGPVA